MANKAFYKSYFVFGIGAAIVYAIAGFIFIQKAIYTESWVLYVGNFMFMIIIGCFLFYFSRTKVNKATSLSLMVSGEKTVIIGVVASCLLSLALLVIMIHGLLGPGTPGKVMLDKPANTIKDKTNGLDFMIIVNSLVGNFVTGSFVSIMLPGSLVKNR